MINGYDFDGTIYNGDSSVDFYLYCLKRKPIIIKYIFIQIWGILLYILGFKEKEYMKEKFFSIVKSIDNIDEYIEDFWKKKIKNIKPWYLEQKDKSDVIISASPEFLLKPLEKKLKVKVIATKVNKKTGKFESKNCHDYEKIERFNKEVKGKQLKSFYSDSMADKPIMDTAQEAYYVRKDKIYDLKKNTNIAKYIKADKKLYQIGLLFLVIPISIQLFFWYNRLISVPCVLLLLIATYFAMKKYKPLEADDYKKLFNKRKIIVFILLIIGINILSGAGGLFPQNWDYHGRNAIFRDLIENPWPVRYDYSGLTYESSIFGTGGILNYYFAFWLPGAIVGKIAGFKAASLFMLLWQTIGVTLFFYYVCRLFRNVKYRYFIIFMAFGGLNVIGHVIMNKYWGFPIHPIGETHIDTSMGTFCMSTFITQLFWVFNQSVPTWVAVTLFLQEKDYRKCGYLFALLVPFGPFPMLGFLYLIFCTIIFGKKLDKFIDFKRIKELFTVENIFGCISVLPIVFMYSLNESHKGCFIIDAIHKGTLKEVLFLYSMFVLLEFLVYIVIINKKNYKHIIMCFAFFAIAPLFYIGGSDLGNRATIPLLIVLYLLVCDRLNAFSRNKKEFAIQLCTVAILLVASVTNFNEIYRSLKHVGINKKFGYSNFADNYYSFRNFEGKECSRFITNFVVTDDKTNKQLQWILRK